MSTVVRRGLPWVTVAAGLRRARGRRGARPRHYFEEALDVTAAVGFALLAAGVDYRVAAVVAEGATNRAAQDNASCRRTAPTARFSSGSTTSPTASSTS